MSNVPTWFAAMIAVLGTIGTLSGPYITRAVAKLDRRRAFEDEVTEASIAVLAAFDEADEVMAAITRQMKARQLGEVTGAPVDQSAIDRKLDALADRLTDTARKLKLAVARMTIVAPIPLYEAMVTLYSEHADHKDRLAGHMLDLDEDPEAATGSDATARSDSYYAAHDALVHAVKEFRETTTYPTKRKRLRKA